MIGNEGVRALMAPLTADSDTTSARNTLLRLDLQWNPFNDVGATYIAYALQQVRRRQGCGSFD
jgi:hypothetical protein